MTMKAEEIAKLNGFDTVTDYVNHAHISCVEAPLSYFKVDHSHGIRELAIFAEHGTDEQRAVLLRHRQYLIDCANDWEAMAKQLREEVIAKLDASIAALSQQRGEA